MTFTLKGEYSTVYILYCVTIITAPIIGTLTGGLITTKCLGGYTSKKAPLLCFGMYIVFICACIPLSYVNNYIAFISIVWVAVVI